MKPGSVLVNVARGEIVDEDALLDAVQHDHLRGAALDVYVGEFERPPMAQLWSDRRVLITPHVSNGSDENRHGVLMSSATISAPIAMVGRCVMSSTGNGVIERLWSTPSSVAQALTCRASASAA
jgi:lactate dehydrogenase-like 2-hydroxyacid dehydrogenase